MEKIIFMTDRLDPDQRILKTLSVLFPECLIQVVASGPQPAEERDASQALPLRAST